MSETKGKIIQFNKRKESKLIPSLFGVILVYMLIIIYGYFTSKHIAGYEVKEGSLAVNNTYRGVIMRTEQVYNAGDSGYIYYYAREGEKVAANSMVYTIDESGKLSDMLKTGYDTGETLTNADMNELKTQIINYRNNFSDYSFSSVYDFKFGVQGTVNKLANKNVLDSLSSISDRSILDLVNFGNAKESGIVVYSLDGLENLATADINNDTFDEEAHAKTQLQSNALVSNGDPAFKLVTEEKWSIVIPVDKERYEELEGESYVKIKFIKTGDVSWGKVDLFTNADNDYYCRFEFTNSMISFVTDRYIDIEVLLNAKKGLKIPNSAIVEKEFYLVPERFLINGGGKDDTGFMREAYMEDGTITTEFVPAQVYYQNEDELYVDINIFRLGDYLLTPDGSEKFAIGKKDTLIGVYNMNKGFADFTQITILYQNREYSIVKSNTDYGLAVYDHIVLEGSAVNDDDFIYEQ